MFWKVGAQYALSPEGSYKSYMLTKDIKQFVEFVLPKLWSTYFDEGRTTTKLENNIIHLKITGLQIKNIYFEYFVMVTFKGLSKFSGRKLLRNRSGVLHRAMRIFISSLH